MGVAKTADGALEDPQGLLRRKSADLVDHVAEGGPVDELLDQECPAAGFKEFVHPDAVDALQPRHYLGLGPEAVQKIGLLLQRWRQLFDGHVALEPRLVGNVNRSRLSGRDRSLELVLSPSF